jgi:Putative zinc-finger
MNCEETRIRLSGWIDQQLDPVENAALEEHLRHCADCRSEADCVRGLHSQLQGAFEAPRAAAARIAEELTRTLPLRTTAAQARAIPSRANWVSISLATAIGFVLALLIFPPGNFRPPQTAGKHEATPEATEPPATSAAPPVARLIVATAQQGVDFRDPNGESWQPVARVPSFQCPSEGALRTDQNARCELVTSDGSVVRLNCGTEVVFHSADKVELKRGEIWCRSTASTPLQVHPSLSAAVIEHSPPSGPASRYSCTVSDAACLLSVAESGDNVRVTAEAGNVSVTARNESRQLKPNETATITRDRIDNVHDADRLLAASWIQPLLVLKGHADPELAHRIDDLLAEVGQSKVSNLYEDEIRRLGEYSVLPLLRYVQSPRSDSDKGRRIVAMQIASDLAPAWAIGDLIGLLSHSDPDVRCLSAAALERLTQQNHGMSVKEWRGAPAKRQPTILAWKNWWSENKSRYPIRFDPSRLPATLEQSGPPTLKAHRNDN